MSYNRMQTWSDEKNGDSVSSDTSQLSTYEFFGGDYESPNFHPFDSKEADILINNPLPAVSFSVVLGLLLINFAHNMFVQSERILKYIFLWWRKLTHSSIASLKSSLLSFQVTFHQLRLIFLLCTYIIIYWWFQYTTPQGIPFYVNLPSTILLKDA